MDQHTMASTPHEPYSLLGDWLIDNGCTIHMTPYIEDFISELSPYQTMVETANGGLVEVSMKGTAKV
jgi:stringent starvation protein B